MAKDTGVDVLPVLASRSQEIDEEVERIFPELTVNYRSRLTDHEGWVFGRAAADLADLAHRAAVTST